MGQEKRENIPEVSRSRPSSELKEEKKERLPVEQYNRQSYNVKENFPTATTYENKMSVFGYFTDVFYDENGNEVGENSGR